MFGNYALVNEFGRVISSSKVSILEVPEGHRLSFLSDAIYGGIFDPEEPQRRIICRPKAHGEIKVEKSFHTDGVKKMYHLSVVGSSAEAVNDLVEELLAWVTDTKIVTISKKERWYAKFGWVRRIINWVLFGNNMTAVSETEMEYQPLPPGIMPPQWGVPVPRKKQPQPRQQRARHPKPRHGSKK